MKRKKTKTQLDAEGGLCNQIAEPSKDVVRSVPHQVTFAGRARSNETCRGR